MIAWSRHVHSVSLILDLEGQAQDVFVLALGGRFVRVCELKGLDSNVDFFVGKRLGTLGNGDIGRGAPGQSDSRSRGEVGDEPRGSLDGGLGRDSGAGGRIVALNDLESNWRGRKITNGKRRGHL